MALLSGGRFLSQLNRNSPMLGSLLQKMIDAQNHGFTQLGVHPVGQAPTPPKPDAVNVTVTGEMAHVRILDNNETNRPRNYFTEVYADPQYTQLLHVQAHGASRDATLTLPTNTGIGVMKDYYMQSYSQTPGSPPSTPIAYPTYVTMDGSTNGDVPPSAGSGTGSANGTQPAQGFGVYSTRKATSVQRQV